MSIKVLIAGFVFGILILPFITLLGLGIPHLEYLKPFLSPGLIAAKPFILSTGENAYRVTTAGWIAFGVTNGIFYAVIFTVVHYFFKRRTKPELINQ